MSQALIFSDLHIHSHKKSQDRLNDCLACLRWVFRTAIEQNVEDVLFLGDFFHSRSHIDILTLHETVRVFEEYLREPRFNLYLLLGNHDLWHRDRLDVYSPSILANFPGVRVVDEPCTLEIRGTPVDFLPFTEDPLTDLARLNRSPARLLCAHLAIHGATLNAYGTESDVVVEHDGDLVQVNSDFLDDWDQVFLGHFHGAQQLTPSVEYVGSPLELSFGETGQQKHLILYNLKTRAKKYIKNDFSPKHLIIKHVDLPGMNLDGQFVIVQTPEMGAAEIADLRRYVSENTRVASLEIRPQRRKAADDKVSVDSAKEVLQSNDDMLVRYIKETKSSLDPGILLLTGQEICRGCVE